MKRGSIVCNIGCEGGIYCKGLTRSSSKMGLSSALKNINSQNILCYQIGYDIIEDVLHLETW